MVLAGVCTPAVLLAVEVLADKTERSVPPVFMVVAVEVVLLSPQVAVEGDSVGLF
jgi:hypothetical protein